MLLAGVPYPNKTYPLFCGFAWPNAAEPNMAAVAPVTMVAIRRSFITFTPLA